MQQNRTNRLMAYRVEKGLTVQQTSTTRAAASYLANYGVPMHVSVRVLTTANRRDMSGYDAQPLWFDIIRAAGLTFGSPVSRG